MGMIGRLAANKWLNLLGVSATLLLGVAGIYSGFFYRRAPELVFEEAANTAVFDVREPVESLAVFYQGTDLRKTGRMLNIVEIRFVNEGAATVVTDDYDPRDLPGVSLERGSILRAQIVRASSPYLRRYARLALGTSEHPVSVTGSLVSRAEARLEPLILEPGDTVVFKLLVLGKAGERPRLEVVGKVAGVNELVYRPAPVEQKSSGSAYAFAGGLDVQAVRVLVYGTVGMLLLVAGIWLFLKVEDLRERRNMRRRARLLMNIEDPTLREAIAKLLPRLRADASALYMLQQSLLNPYARQLLLAEGHCRQELEALGVLKEGAFDQERAEEAARAIVMLLGARYATMLRGAASGPIVAPSSPRPTEGAGSDQ